VVEVVEIIELPHDNHEIKPSELHEEEMAAPGLLLLTNP
jgi:hypothetical protein